ncbi:MAG TPA: zf-TFIIB domain-containing protein [Tepidiformaceae bacterium]|nr:zf-TFIIB domain-containing protein [Tepidiformaceae bacterium]
MTTSADERWLAAARARAAAGSWERDPEEIFGELRRLAAERSPAPPGPRCPYCADHPGLVTFRRHELQTIDPLRFCGQCYGFWAVGDSLSRGVADPGYGHPALEQALAPRRCRACHGRLKPDNSCRSCGQPLPALHCPGCGNQMERFEKEGIWLDQCAPCRGTWFDVGEIVAVYQLRPHQGLAASTVDEHATGDELPAWEIALGIVGRMLLPFLPL